MLKTIASGAFATLMLGAVVAPSNASDKLAGNGTSLNGVSLNRLATNKLAANKLAANKLAANRIALNRLAANGVGAAVDVKTAEGTVDRVVSIEFPDGRTYAKAAGE